jgi:hypothetical protein
LLKTNAKGTKGAQCISTFANDCCNLSRKKFRMHGQLDEEMFHATYVATPLLTTMQH